MKIYDMGGNITLNWLKLKKYWQPSMVVCTCNPSTQEAEQKD
jgi:hypothetical protein